MNIEKLQEYYSNCFNSTNTATTPDHFEKQNEVNARLNLLKNERFQLSFTDSQIEYTINQLNQGKAFGFDCVTAEMLKNSNTQHLAGSIRLYSTMG